MRTPRASASAIKAAVALRGNRGKCTKDAATWGAELAMGTGRGRIYIVEPTGPIEDDPNLTDRKFPGNVTRSYRSRSPFRVVGEVTDWQGHSPERLRQMRDRIEELRQRGVEVIED